MAATTQRPRPLERASDALDRTLARRCGAAGLVPAAHREERRVAREAVAPRRSTPPSLLVGRPGAGGRPRPRARHFKMLTARATTRIATTREMASSAIIMSFIQGFTADTSVGLKAVAVAKAKWK